MREKRRQLFGLPDKPLGEHIEAAYQALAINELREDFVSSVRAHGARLYADADMFFIRNVPSLFKPLPEKRKAKF